MKVEVSRESAEKIAAVAGLDLVTEGRETKDGFRTVEEICPYEGGAIVRVTEEMLVQSMMDGFTIPALLGEAIRPDVRQYGAEQVAKIEIEAVVGVINAMVLCLRLRIDVRCEPLAVITTGGSIDEEVLSNAIITARRSPLPYVVEQGGVRVEIRPIEQHDPTAEEEEQICREIDAELGFKPAL